jgi:SAM-dependent methyltransferase
MAVAQLSAPAAAQNSAQETINGRLYRSSNLVQTYAATKLHPAESTALVRYRDHVLERPVLDLGCGAGRLATYLRPLTEQYVGFDVSAYMVDYCRRAYPDFTFVQGDMRSLAPFAVQSFDTVFAVANLFDAVSHEERRQVLAEVRRILAPDGLLIFSAHNRNYINAGCGPRLEFHRNPMTQARVFVDYLQASRNHRRIKPLHRFEPEYALLNDSGNNYFTLHYYVTREVQGRQLAAAGFELLECLDDAGLTLKPGDSDAACSSLFYIARRTHQTDA